MSKQKKYFWLKLKDDFFTDPKLKKLRRIAGGDTYTVIYLKMMLLSIKNGGLIEFQGIEKTLSDELSLILDEDEINVNATLIYLDKMGMIEAISEQSYLMQNVPELIGSETDSAERVRRLRANKALQCNSEVTECNTEKEKEIDKEIELEKEKKINTPKSYDSESDFSLSRDTHYDNLSKEYKEALQVFIESMGLLYPFDDFVNSLQAKASYKYKNFVKTYRTWAKNHIPKQVPQQRMDISKLPEGVSLQDMLNEAGEQWEQEQAQKQIGGGR